METFLAYLSDKAPGVFIAIIACAIVWCIAKFYFTRFKKTEEKIDEIDKTVASLPCDQHHERIDKQKKQTGNIREKITSIDDKVTVIAEWIMRQDKKTIISLGGKKSPTALTNTGWEFLKISGGKKCIDDHLDFFISELEKVNPSSPYDVEEGAKRVLLSNIGNDAFYTIKDYIYFSPETVNINGTEVEISLMTTTFVMSIYLRDMYFEKHPELNFRKDLDQ